MKLWVEVGVVGGCVMVDEMGSCVFFVFFLFGFCLYGVKVGYIV